MKFSSKAKREVLVTLLILCAGFLFYIFLFGESGYFQVRAYRIRLEQLKIQNENLRLRKLNLEESVRKLKEDPEAVERIAREELNMARPGDVIINLPEKPDVTPPRKTPEP